MHSLASKKHVRAGTGRKPRGFILLEALAGGVILAVMITTVLTQMSVAQQQVIMGSRDLAAKQILQRQLERVMSTGYATAAVSTAADVEGVQGFKYTVTVTSGATPSYFSTFVNSYNDVTVTLTYKVGSANRTQSATSRQFLGAPP